MLARAALELNTHGASSVSPRCRACVPHVNPMLFMASRFLCFPDPCFTVFHKDNAVFLIYLP